MKIRSKLFITYTVVALIPIIALSSLLYYKIKSSILSYTIEELKLAAELKVDAIESYFNNFKTDIIIAQSYLNIQMNMPKLIFFQNDAKNPVYQDALKKLDSQYIPYYKEKGLIAFILLDIEKKIVYTADKRHREVETGRNITSVYPVKDLNSLNNNDVWLSDVFMHDNRIELLIFNHLYNNLDGKLLGYVVFGINMENINSLLRNKTGLGSTGETVVGIKDGDEALFISPDFGGKRQN